MDPGDFFKAMIDKFRLRAEQHNRSLEPWNDYEPSFLFSGLEDEIVEFFTAIRRSYGITLYPPTTPLEMSDAAADELPDISNYCMFLWLQHQIRKDSTK
jgi:NTP pyrophosphatase (non-canonical NTP hydrolase)